MTDPYYFKWIREGLSYTYGKHMMRLVIRKLKKDMKSRK